MTREDCKRCEHWFRMGLSATCPTCDSLAAYDDAVERVNSMTEHQMREIEMFDFITEKERG